MVRQAGRAEAEVCSLEGVVSETERGRFSLAVLMVLVLSVTAQLITGSLLLSHYSSVLLSIHVVGGLAAFVALLFEWSWLIASEHGRRVAMKMFGAHCTWSQRIDGLFLIMVSLVVLLGLWLAAILHFGIGDALFGVVLRIHQAMAGFVACLWVLHFIQTLTRRIAHG